MVAQSSTPSSKSDFLQGISEIGIVIGLTMLLPFLVHFIPSWDDSPIGGKLLPIFYAPLIAAITRKLHVSLIASLLSPWINYLIFGAPALPIAWMLFAQLMPFAFIAYWMHRKLGSNYFNGVVAYLVSKPLIALLFFALPQTMGNMNLQYHLIQATLHAWPGLIIIALISRFAERLFHPPAGHA